MIQVPTPINIEPLFISSGRNKSTKANVQYPVNLFFPTDLLVNQKLSLIYGLAIVHLRNQAKEVHFRYLNHVFDQKN